MLRKHDVYSLKISFYYLSQTGHLWKISTSFCTEGMPLTQRFSSRQSPNSTRYVIQNSIQSQKRKEKSALYDNSTISKVISLSLSLSLSLRASTTSLATTTCASWCLACRKRTPIPGWRASGRCRQHSSRLDPRGKEE